MANTNLTSAFISLNDIINNFIISYTGPGKLIPDSKRTEVVFHARRCLQEFSYETLKSQFTFSSSAIASNEELEVPVDFVAVISLVVNTNTYTQVQTSPGIYEYVYDYDARKILFSNGAANEPNIELTYLSNALTTDENAAIPKLAEEALYACMVYAILANRTNTDPNLLQRLLIEKIDKLERSKSRLVFTNFSE
jgi:hypothetical protein